MIWEEVMYTLDAWSSLRTISDAISSAATVENLAKWKGVSNVFLYTIRDSRASRNLDYTRHPVSPHLSTDSCLWECCNAAFFVKLQKCLCSTKLHRNFASAAGWVDNDWICIYRCNCSFILSTFFLGIFRITEHTVRLTCNPHICCTYVSIFSPIKG